MWSAPGAAPLSALKERLAVGILLAVLAGELALAAVSDGLTIDEVIYIGAGYRHLTAHDYRPNPEQPPLAKLWGALPLLALSPKEPGTGDPADWGWCFRFIHVLNDPGRMIPLARLPNAALTVACALGVWGWSRRVHGPGAGLFALCLFVFHPSLLAHGHLLTTDLPGTFTMLLAAWTFWRWTLKPSPAWSAAVGGALALAVATRLTGWLLVPCLGLLVAREWSRAADRRRFAAQVAALALAVAVLVPLGIWAAYGFRYAPYPGASVGHAPGPWLGRTGKAIALLQSWRGLPEAYLEGARFVSEHNALGHPTYLLGRVSDTGWPHYYLVAFLVKNTPGFLLALAFLGVSARDASKGLPASGIALHWLLPAAVTFAAASTGRIQIGERYILPIYPFLILLAARASPVIQGWRGGPALLAGILVLHAVPSLAAARGGYLPYFNLLAGGTRGGHRVLADSNLDWGQDLPRLAAWMSAHKVAEVQLAYHGSDDPDRFGIRREDLPGMHLYVPRPPVHPFSGTVVVSPNLLLGIFYPPGQNPYATLKDRAPDDRAGVYFVYRLPVEGR